MSTGNNALHQLEIKISNLQKIVASNPPTDPALQKAHQSQVAQAKSFRDELMVISNMLQGISDNRQVLLVTKPTFDKTIQKADFSTV